MIKIIRNSLFVLTLTLIALPLYAAEEYKMDTKGAHAFIQFRIQHLGYSWLYGRFNDFNGSFRINRDDLSKSSVEVYIDTNSVDTNHAERDKHLRSKDFLNVKEYPQAKFLNTSIKQIDKKSAIIKGDFTLNGVTKSIELKAKLVGEGKDPWGGYRMGFEASTILILKDFNINHDLGSASTTVQIMISVEGVKQ